MLPPDCQIRRLCWHKVRCLGRHLPQRGLDLAIQAERCLSDRLLECVGLCGSSQSCNNAFIAQPPSRTDFFEDQPSWLKRRVLVIRNHTFVLTVLLLLSTSPTAAPSAAVDTPPVDGRLASPMPTTRHVSTYHPSCVGKLPMPLEPPKIRSHSQRE